MSRLTLPLLALWLLASCAEIPPRSEPAPVIDGTARVGTTTPPPAAPLPARQDAAFTAPGPIISPVPPPLDPRSPLRTPQQQQQQQQPSDGVRIYPIQGAPPETPVSVEFRSLESRPPEPRPPEPRPWPPQPLYDAESLEESLKENLEGPAGLGIGTRTTADDPNTRITTYESTHPEPPSPAHSRAVATLLAIAERERTAGNFDLAAMQVERATDLEPRNPDLWHRLARLRMAQGQLEQAEQAARRSAELAGGNLPLRRSNWQLISEIRFELGDSSGAEQAARFAESLY